MEILNKLSEKCVTVKLYSKEEDRFVIQGLHFQNLFYDVRLVFKRCNVPTIKASNQQLLSVQTLDLRRKVSYA